MSRPAKYVGQSVKRVEDSRLIQGNASYVDDLKFVGLLHAAVYRSPHAHARILSIKTDAAKALPGVAGVFVGADVNTACGTIPCASDLPGRLLIKL